MCRNVHVARPRTSTSGGQFSGRVGVTSVDVAAATAVAAAVAATADVDPELSEEDPATLDALTLRGQLRNAVQILQGLPSGPMTQPGGGFCWAVGAGGFVISG